ncbi:MAG: adenylyl-sulfate kinase [Lachnospiraceae bacterium]|nr:adenylyl-sulfate kinase [Lachnospiraceae bacterium]
MHKEGILYWITGLSGAGKTTIGNRLFYELREANENVILLDGDMLKEIVDDTVSYSDKDRRNRAMKYAKICRLLTNQDMIVICCTIAMYDEVRNWNRRNNKRYVEIFLDVPDDVLRSRDQKGLYSGYADGKIANLAGADIEVEFPKNPDLRINNDGSEAIEAIVQKILDFTPPSYRLDYDRDAQYWNAYYGTKNAPQEPSLFAQWILSRIKSGKNILDIGCGNGRDSLFFQSKGLNVTAIDASERVIKDLKEKTKGSNIYFICDDFVCSSAIYAGQYDYCYSRFSLHAINEKQEKEVLENVYKVLKQGGEFFIEVRSVNDELYGKGKKVGTDSYFYDGHFRRFIRKSCLLESLRNVGFTITYENEARGFAPFGESDPPIIRIIAMK